VRHLRIVVDRPQHLAEVAKYGGCQEVEAHDGEGHANDLLNLADTKTLGTRQL